MSVDRLAVLPLLAMVLLLIQWMIGFPVEPNEADIEEAIRKNLIGEALEEAAIVRMKPAFFLELLVLGIPVLILVNGWLYKCRKIDE